MDAEAPSIEIRPARVGELPEIAAIEQEVNPSPWSERQFRDELGNDCAYLDLLLVDGVIAAYLSSWLIADELQIQNIATSPRFRRNGYAERLLRQVLQRVADSGANRAFLEVRSGNAGARKLYEKLNFDVCGCRTRYYADNEDAILMELDIVNAFDAHSGSVQ